MDITNISPSLKAALLAEIEKALPRLLAKAERKVAAKDRAPPAPRLPKGLARQAITRAIWALADTGGNREQIQQLASRLLKGQPPLNYNTLRRYLVTLKQEDQIENRNGLWYPVGSSAPGRAKTRLPAPPPAEFAYPPLMRPVYPKETDE